MTRIEKAVKIVSDLYDFYQRIPKVSDSDQVKEKEYKPSLRRGEKREGEGCDTDFSGVSHSLCKDGFQRQ